MRKRLRPVWDADTLAEMYRRPHNHTRWPDHLIRVDVTRQVAKWLLRRQEWTHEPTSVADLSCGDAVVADSLGLPHVWLGDLAPGYRFTGPIERTLDDLRKVAPEVDLFVCLETIEHLDDPDAVLKRIREQASALVLSTPIGEEDTSRNPEHYWGWDVDAVWEMLTAAGWFPQTLNELRFFSAKYPYAFQVWGCR